jgi:hypothetical protein
MRPEFPLTLVHLGFADLDNGFALPVLEHPAQQQVGVVERARLQMRLAGLDELPVDFAERESPKPRLPFLVDGVGAEGDLPEGDLGLSAGLLRGELPEPPQRDALSPGVDALLDDKGAVPLADTRSAKPGSRLSRRNA